MNMTKAGLMGLVLVVFFCVFSLALAQEAKPGMPLPSPTPIEYILPYPGILPDHPLYIFKEFRDWLLLSLITSPERKIDFELLTGDKRLNMAIFLVSSNKKPLALKTLDESVNLLVEAQSQLKNVSTIQPGVAANTKERYKKSLTKHIEVVTELRSQFSQTQDAQMGVLLKKLSELQILISP